MKLVIPPTRTHRQLAQWINKVGLVDARGREVAARAVPWTSNTDRKIGRLRRPGKGRKGLRLEIVLVWGCPVCAPIYSHTSTDTYRTHEEARAWVASNLKRSNR